MRKRRKTEKCLNCDYPLSPAFNFCPACGQENTNRQLSFGKLLNDFFSNYFSLDSRFGRSFKPFFFKPGLLTKEFMDGKRVKYANPIRLYLVVSLIHFFVLSIYTSDGSEDTKGSTVAIEAPPTLPPEAPADSIENANSETTTTTFGWLTDEEWNIFQKMTAEDEYSVEEIADSLNLEEKPFLPRYLTRQAIKVAKSDESSIEAYILENIPILMFLLLPLYALLLKAFFSKKLYINHLVHSLHIHSFVFIVLTFYWLALLIFPNIPDQANIFVFSLLAFYIWVSFKNTYKISKWSASYKVLLSGFVYCIIMSISLLLELIISLLTY